MLNFHLNDDLNHLCKNEMPQNPTFALSNENAFPIESGLIKKNQRLEKICRAVLAVLRKIQHDGKKVVEL